MSSRAQKSLKSFSAREIEFKFDLARRALDIEDELGQGTIGFNLVKKHGSGSSSKSYQPGQHALVQTLLEVLPAWSKGEGALTFLKNYNR